MPCSKRITTALFTLGLTLSAMSISLTDPVAAGNEGGRDLYRAPSNFAGKTLVLPIGTAFEGRIQSTIGSNRSRSGQRFSIEVSAPLMANGSEVLIPSGSEVIGEVAEAISSGSQPHDKGTLKPMGILRVQLSTLKLPDGMIYPIVASLAPDGSGKRRGGRSMDPRKSSVGYIGTQAGFDAVNPALQPRTRNSTGKLQVLKKQDILNDPILGESGRGSSASGSGVRALVRKNRDVYILQGSSLTVRLDAPLKIAFGASTGQTSMEEQTSNEALSGGSGKRFAKSRPAAAEGGGDQDDGGGAPQSSQGFQQQSGGGQSQQQQRQQPNTPGGVLTSPVEQPGSSF